MTEEPQFVSQPVSEEPYERKFSFGQRFYRLLTSPREAMMDIGYVPDYEGAFVVVLLELVVVSVGLAVILQKFQFSGQYASRLTATVGGLLTVAVFLGIVVYVAVWLATSAVVQYVCDAGSGWEFKTAASVTGYAYVVDLVLGVLGIVVVWLFIPTVQIDTSSLQAATQAINSFQARVEWFRLLYSLPVWLVGLLWRAYVGGLGAYYGTRRKCKFVAAVAVFFIIGLIGMFISWVLL